MYKEIIQDKWAIQNDKKMKIVFNMSLFIINYAAIEYDVTCMRCRINYSAAGITYKNNT